MPKFEVVVDIHSVSVIVEAENKEKAKIKTYELLANSFVFDEFEYNIELEFIDELED